MTTISWFRKVCTPLFLGAIVLPLAASVRIRAIAAPLLTIDGEVERPLALEASDLAKLPRRTVRVEDRDGAKVTFEGVLLLEVLRQAGVPFGSDRLRGQNMALYLLVEAADGYRVVFALPELDPSFSDRIILLADRQDGKPLSASEGQLRLVVPDEKRHSRWVRQVTKLRILRAD